jgi:hypothetical protein
MIIRRIDSQSRIDSHNANIVDDVAQAGGCGLENLQHGSVCGLVARHAGPCKFMSLRAVRTTRGLAQTGAIALQASKP